MKKPKILKHLQRFLGLVTFYHDMWPQWLHVLTPLTNLLSTTKYIWSNKQDIAFLHMRSLVIKILYWYFLTPKDNSLLRQMQAITNFML